MKLFGRVFGGALIVAGTTIGAGLLAIPITSAHLGLTGSALLMLGVFLFMSYAALVTLEINFHFGKSINISSAAEKVLGPWARSLASFALVFLYYSLLWAYISGGASTLKASLPNVFHLDALNPKFLQLLFTLALGFFIYSRTSAVDYFNRFLFTAKLVFFFLLITMLLPAVSDTNLHSSSPLFGPFWISIPIFITSFGYHGSIHSIVDYVGLSPKKLLITFIIGGSLPFILYLTWQYVSIGTLPLFGPHSFEVVAQNNNDVGVFIREINAMIKGTTINWATNAFSCLAIATSFLGVGLGLFDFFAQKTHQKNTHFGRFKSSLITFVFPLILAFFFPRGFIPALGFAGAALTIIAVIIPSLTALKLRKDPEYNPTFKVPGGKIALYGILLGGVGILLAELGTLVFY